MGSRSPMRKEFFGKGTTVVNYRDCLHAVSYAKTTELIEILFGLYRLGWAQITMYWIGV